MFIHISLCHRQVALTDPLVRPGDIRLLLLMQGKEDEVIECALTGPLSFDSLNTSDSCEENISIT